MMFVLLTVFAVSNLPNILTRETGLCEEIISIQPVDPYFLESEDVVLHCYSNTKAQHLTFYLGQDKHPVDENFIHGRNTTYVQLVIPGITASDVKAYKVGRVIYCMDKINGTCIDNEYIMLEYYPITPENITCEVFNFENLSCTWDLGVQYKFKKHIRVSCQFVFNVSTKYKITPNASGWASCPNGTDTSCFWDKSIYHNSLHIVLNVSVKNTKRNITVSKNVTFNRDDIVKPGKVKGLNVTSTKDPTCVNVEWVPPSLYRNFTYTITYISECESTQKVIQYRCDSERHVCWYQLCGLNPFTLYNLTVVSRYTPDWVEKGFESDPTVITFWTDKTIPEKSPLVTDGSYLYGSNYLTLYVQPLKECDQHSNDTNYQVTVDGINETYPGTEYRIEIRLRSDDSDVHKLVQIVTKNDIGVSEKMVSMEIYPENEGPLPSELIIEYSDNKMGCREYFATVLVDPGNDRLFYNITHTVTWCKVASQDCMQPMYWLENVNAESRHKLPVQDCVQTYKFGLITKGAQRSDGKGVWTGINFVDCQFLYDTVPKVPLPDIHLPKVMVPNTLTVEWKPYPCEEPAGFIQNYIVTYCEAKHPETNDTCDCVEKRREIAVSNKKSVYTVEDLASNVDICVWVSASTSAGRGPTNKHILFHTVQPGEEKIYIVLIIICIFVMFVVILFLARYCWSRWKSYLKEKTRIEHPQILWDDPKGEHSVPLQPISPKYPVNDINQDEPNNYNNDFDDSDFSDDISADIDKCNESQELLSGYADPTELAFEPGGSLNSQLSDFDGRTVINGKPVKVKSRNNVYVSLADLTKDDYVTPIEMTAVQTNNTESEDNISSDLSSDADDEEVDTSHALAQAFNRELNDTLKSIEAKNSNIKNVDLEFAEKNANSDGDKPQESPVSNSNSFEENEELGNEHCFEINNDAGGKSDTSGYQTVESMDIHYREINDQNNDPDVSDSDTEKISDTYLPVDFGNTDLPEHFTTENVLTPGSILMKCDSLGYKKERAVKPLNGKQGKYDETSEELDLQTYIGGTSVTGVKVNQNVCEVPAGYFGRTGPIKETLDTAPIKLELNSILKPTEIENFKETSPQVARTDFTEENVDTEPNKMESKSIIKSTEMDKLESKDSSGSLHGYVFAKNCEDKTINDAEEKSVDDTDRSGFQTDIG